MIQRVLRVAYRRLPLTVEQKLRTKGFLFEQFPRLFKGWPPYEAWRRQVEGLAALPRDYTPAPSPQAPSYADWDALAARGRLRDAAHADPAAPYVVVPVYSGLAETLACLYSVVAAPVAARFELLVIFDCSDDRELRQALRNLAARGFFTLQENESNRGFVGTANRGLDYGPERDVVLLNADTEVYGDWLDRLSATAGADRAIATVTPLTNNGEIASYPFWPVNNPQRLECGYAELDALAARANAGQIVDVPTGVGFCLYLKRAALAEVGTLDEATFQRGYGEENDLCLRAEAAGWRNVLAGDVFVRHFGAVSFGKSKRRAVRRGVAKVERLHHGYQRRIQEYIVRDPVRRLRARLDAARLLRHFGLDAQTAGTSLFVLHGLGGGTWTHAQGLARRLIAEGRPVLFLLPDGLDPRHAGLFWVDASADDRGAGAGAVRMDDGDLPATPNVQRVDLDRHADSLVEACIELGVDHVHVHHVIGFSPSAPEALQRLIEGIAAPFDVTLHDYTMICPRAHCNDEHGVYCGLPEESECETCIRKRGAVVDTPSVWLWRRQSRRLLQGARRIFAPSASLARTIERYYPEISVTVRPHFEDLSRIPHVGIREQAAPRKRVALLGAIGDTKGYYALTELARDAARRDLPIDFSVIGYTQDDAPLRRLGVEITGAYTADTLGEQTARVAPDIALFLSLWPETHCYTLSEALALGLYPVAVDLGAPGTRLRELNWGTLIDLEEARTPSRLNDRLCSLQPTPAPDRVRDRSWLPAYPSILGDYYGFASAPAPAAVAQGRAAR